MWIVANERLGWAQAKHFLLTLISPYYVSCLPLPAAAAQQAWHTCLARAQELKSKRLRLSCLGPLCCRC